MTPPLEDLARLYFLETPAQLRDYLWEKSCLRIKLGIDDGRTEPPPGLWGRGCHESHRAWPWLGWGSGSPALPPAGPPSRGRTAPKAGAARTPAPGESRGSAPLTALTRSIKASSEDTARRAAYRGAPAHSGCLTPPLRAAPRRTAARSPRPPDRSIAHSLSNAERGSAAAAQTPAADWLTDWLAGWLAPSAPTAPQRRWRPAERSRSPRQDALSAAIQSCRRPGGRLCTPKQWRARARWLVPPWRHSPPGPRHLSDEGAAPGPLPSWLDGSETFKLHWKWQRRDGAEAARDWPRRPLPAAGRGDRPWGSSGQRPGQRRVVDVPPAEAARWESPAVRSGPAGRRGLWGRRSRRGNRCRGWGRGCNGSVSPFIQNHFPDPTENLSFDKEKKCVPMVTHSLGKTYRRITRWFSTWFCSNCFWGLGFFWGGGGNSAQYCAFSTLLRVETQSKKKKNNTTFPKFSNTDHRM